MKISYSVEHLRRIQKMPLIELRPLTLLVGRNSAGKSTFLRSLPLLRQSIETRSSAPILWFGDLVDFGDFHTAVSSKEESKETAFTFSLADLDKKGSMPLRAYGRYTGRISNIKIEQATVRYEIGASKNRTILRKIEVTIPDSQIEFCIDFNKRNFSEGQISINGEKIEGAIGEVKLAPHRGSIFSTPRLMRQQGKAGDENWLYGEPAMVLGALIERMLTPRVTTVGSRTIEHEASRMISAFAVDPELISDLGQKSKTEAFRSFYSGMKLRPESKGNAQILRVLQANRAFAVLEILNDLLFEFCQSVSYMGPARAAGERFYRKQELEVAEIASNGANFPMFLASLAEKELAEFSNFVYKIFGYGVGVHSSEGHISIRLKTGGSDVNITDTGYGVSQILPVLGSVWWGGRQKTRPWLFRGRNRQSMRTLAIEQPEVHLHPAHQAKLADLFVSAVTAEKTATGRAPSRFIIETHSEALINRLGELVAEGKISPQDVQIIIFDAEDDLNSPSKITTANFNEAGVLTNWPFGFFNYESL